MKPSVYLCGPITGMSYGDARYGWRSAISLALSSDIDVLSPMRQEGHLSEIQKIADEPYDWNALSKSRGIVAKDYLDVQRCTILVINVSGAQIVSKGSLIEVGWARAFGKTIVLVMEDAGNVHDSFFLREQCDFIVPTVQEAAEIVNALLTPGI